MKASKVFLIVITIFILLVVCCVSCILLGVYAFNEIYKTEENLGASVSFPDKILASQEFEMEMVLTNEGTEKLAVKEIDFSQSFLEGMTIESSVPQYLSVDGEPVLGFTDVTYSFGSIELNPGESKTIVFSVKAKEAGFYSGPITIYLTRLFNSLPIYESYEVEETAVPGNPTR
jgi:hypothetical protein